VLINPSVIKHFLFNDEYRAFTRLGRCVLRERGEVHAYSRQRVAAVETVEDYLFGTTAWSTTSEGRTYLDMARLGRRFHGGYAATEPEVERYFADLRRALDDIVENGFKPIYDDPVVVYLSRGGSFISVLGGRHRIRIAQLLRIAVIPVKLDAQHACNFLRRLGLQASCRPAHRRHPV